MKKQTEQAPVAWVERDGELVWNNREAAIGRNLYTAPPRREWAGLTEEEIDACHEEIRVQLMNTYNTKDIYRVLEAKLKEKNA